MNQLKPIESTYPWIMRMKWHELAFLHWPIHPDKLRPFIPDGLQIDTYQGQAWIGVVPFRMSGIGARGLPLIPGTHQFLELNVRTYVVTGDRPGVWFFSLDAANSLAVFGARWSFALPYYNARMHLARRDNKGNDSSIDYTSNRFHRNAPEAKFRASYGPIAGSDPYQSVPGTLEHWLTERYCLYSLGRNKKLYRGEINHRPWPLQKGWANIDENSMTHSLGLHLADPPALIHYAEFLDVQAWYLTLAES